MLKPTDAQVQAGKTAQMVAHILVEKAAQAHAAGETQSRFYGQATGRS